MGESDAAVWGATAGDGDPGPIVLAAVEHSAVRDASARAGPCVIVPVDRTGRIEPGTVENALARTQAEFGLSLIHI